MIPPYTVPLATSHHYGFIGCLYIRLHINSGILWANLALPNTEYGLSKWTEGDY